MIKKKDIPAKIAQIFKSPIDAEKIINDYSEDLLLYALMEYRKWQQREGSGKHSVNYFKKIIQTNLSRFTNKKIEKDMKNEEKLKKQKEALKKSETLHEIIYANNKARNFLEMTITKLSKADREVTKARARNHLCFSKSAEKLDEEMRNRIDAGEKIEEIVEEFNNKIENLNQMCMLVEIRNMLFAGYFWKEADVNSTEQLKKFIEV